MTTQSTAHFTHIIKRDGGIKPFDAGKIAQALERAAQVTGEFDAAEAGAGRVQRGAGLPRQ